MKMGCKKIQLIVLFLVLITSDLTFGKGNNKTKTQKPNQQKKSNNTKSKYENERIKRSTNDYGTIQFWPNKESISLMKTMKNENWLQDAEDIPVYGKIRGEAPFWHARGRRDSSESDEPQSVDYDLKQNNDYITKVHLWNDPDSKSSANFWANRGRRQDKDPFWGSRGKKEENVRYVAETEESPFWANRGRRRDQEQFESNLDKNNDIDPFWGSRGRRKDLELTKDNKEYLKQNILSSINNVENEIELLSRLRRSPGAALNFWSTRVRDSKLKHLFNGNLKNKISSAAGTVRSINPLNARALTDSRMFAEEPHYILMERNARSSAEDDPFFISRGKKYFLNYNVGKSARDRRGAIEEIVKSVRNDPYYIARGKKDFSNGNLTQLKEYTKIKELVCSAIDLVMYQNNNHAMKRDITDSERDRRIMLKKIADQLQNDPYVASRGKRASNDDDDHLYEFIKDVAAKCS